MVNRTVLVAIAFGEVLAHEPCPADFMSQAVSSMGEIDDLEDVASLDLVSMLQVSVTAHYRRGASNSSKAKEAIAHMNLTESALQAPLTSAKKEVADHFMIHMIAKDYPQIETSEPAFLPEQSTSSKIQQSGWSHVDCSGPRPCQPKAELHPEVLKANTQLPDEQLNQTQREKAVANSEQIIVNSSHKQQFEQQELALFLESLAEELVHDLKTRFSTAFHSGWTTCSAFIFPFENHSSGYLERNARLCSFAVYCEIFLVSLLTVVSLSLQHKRWRLPQLQTVEVHLVLSLAVLSGAAYPSFCSAFTLGLRYFVEGYMLLVALYVLPSTLGRCMTEAQVKEQRRAAEHFVLQGEGFEPDSCHMTPPLLDVAIEQHSKQPEIAPFPSSLPPVPCLLAVILCLVRPLLGISCALVQHHHPPAMTICLWSNTWLTVFGLILTAGLVRDIFSQIAQYVPTCEIVALSVGLLPVLGGVQDVALYGSMNSGAVSYAGMLYLHEVTAITIFVMYMVSQEAHFPMEKLLCNDDAEVVAGWQRWLWEVLNPDSVLQLLKLSTAVDVESAENALGAKGRKHELHTTCCLYDSA